MAHRPTTAALLMVLGLCILAQAEPPDLKAPTASRPAAAEPSLKEQMAQLEALQTAIQQKLLAVPAEDQHRLAKFLQQPDTGLIKLLPRETYDRVLRIRGGGAYYSFARRDHEYGHGSDIELQQGRLSCGFAGGDYGYFVALGDVPIEKAATVAAAAAPQWAPAEAAARWQEFWSDVPVDSDTIREREMDAWQRNRGVPFVRGVSARPSSTFLLRSVSPARADVLVAFRVERGFENDGSVLISWKLLKKFTPVDRIQFMLQQRQRRQEEQERRLQQLREQNQPKRQEGVF
jgi:hypothetical protein